MIMKIAQVKTFVLPLAVAAFTISVAACSPEVGSEEWCNDLKEKPKGEWTTNEATDFAKHCVL